MALTEGYALHDSMYQRPWEKPLIHGDPKQIRGGLRGVGVDRKGKSILIVIEATLV